MWRSPYGHKILDYIVVKTDERYVVVENDQNKIGLTYTVLEEKVVCN